MIDHSRYPVPVPARALAGVALWLALALPAAWASADAPAEALVRATTDTVLERIREEPAIAEDRARLYAFVDETILPHFDFTRMSERVLGRAWRSASEDQRERFRAEFQTLLVRTYATALAAYENQRVEYLPGRHRPERKEYSVNTRIVQEGSPPIPIKYQMYGEGQDWKVFDVAIDGVSLVLNFRSTFVSEIRRSGLDALIERLAQRNLEKSGATQ